MAKAKTQVGTCVVDGCDKEQYAWHMCKKHQRRLRTTGRTDLGERIPWNKKHETCTVEKCYKQHRAQGFCQMHYRRLTLHGDVNVRARGHKGRASTYKMIVVHGHPNANSKGIIAEHRYVMSEYLGRTLLSNENVHHINGDRKDNRIENLELWSEMQPSGQRVEDKVEYALEILRLYAPEHLSEVSA